MSEENNREEQNQVFQTSPPPLPSPNRVAQQSGFEIPVEVVPLPSKGAVYNVDNPLCNEQNVEIKAMTAKEEDLLTSQALIKNGTVLSKLLESCILNKTIHADGMVTGDRNAVLTALRISGYGPEYEVRTKCPECDEEFNHVFNLAEIPIKPLGAKPLESNTNIFSFTLPSSQKTVYFKLLTGADELDLSRSNAGRRKVSVQIQRNVTSRLAKSILAIDSERDPQKLAYAVQNMAARDSRALRNYIDDIEPGMNMKQNISCEYCGERSEVRVPLGLTFFWPDASV